MESFSLGVDLGGTKIEAVVLRDDTRAEVARVRVPTDQEEGYEAIVARVASIISRVRTEAGVPAERTTIGVGMPGGVARASGLVKNSNTVCLNGRPFREDLARTVGAGVAFENDANCFALAEAIAGAGAPYVDGVVFGVIMGTGVGGGVVLSGRLWPGPQGLAGEWGHHAVWGGQSDARACYCGQRGCLEQYASGPAVERDYAERAGERHGVAEIATRRGDDPHARAAIEGLIDAFGRGLANLIDMLDPSVVVLGGGLSNLALLTTEGAERVRRYVFNDELATPIVKNALGDSAGVVGAALVGAALVDATGASRSSNR
jgi:fructokinase